jgi:hypothetical protein
VDGAARLGRTASGAAGGDSTTGSRGRANETRGASGLRMIFYQQR